MTDRQYIKFKVIPSTLEEKKKNGLSKKILTTILFFIPKANPDFDDLIDDVNEWQLEINTADNSPTREIGIDKNGQIIMIMPWHDNYGFWTDNNNLPDHFREQYSANEISESEFDNNWNSFIKQKINSGDYEFDKRGFSKYYRFLENRGWKHDGFMTFTKGTEHILFDTSECFYIEIDEPKSRKEFQCKNLDHFANVIKNNTTTDPTGST